MNASPPKTKRARLVLAGGLLAIIGIITIGVMWVDRTLKPSRAEVEAIEAGMSKDEVLHSLGAHYDEAHPDELSGPAHGMPELDSIEGVASVMVYSISRSSDTAWILLDDSDRVLKQWITSPEPGQ